MKLRIIHKGLLLLLLPFAIEAVLFAFLLTLNQKAEELAVEERQRTKFMRCITGLLQDSGVAWADILNRLSSTRPHNDFAPLSPQNYRVNTDQQLKELNAMPLKSDRMGVILREVKELRDVQADTLDALEDNSDSFADLSKLRELKARSLLLRSSLKVSKRKLVEVKRLLQMEQDLIDESIAAERVQREMVKKLLLAGLVVQVAITICLLLFFLNNITRRLNMLVQNARTLPTGEELPQKVSGRDEIAYLDVVLHDASAKLEEASQNRQSIMNMIAHDIRSPLMSSNLLLEKLSAEIKSPTAGATTQRLRNTFQQLSTLVEDLLAIDKHESGTLELNLSLFDLAALVDEVIEIARPQAEKNSVYISASVTAVEVVADRVRISQVLTNLISNAIKYSTAGGKIEISGKIKSNGVTVTVKDNGKGISEKDLPFIFDKFFQASNSTGSSGFGLGLAISKLIIASHGGKLGAESTPGQGSTFWFILPLDD